ncbi:MAG: PDZ domain-containing protein, partial [Candidatus Eisenbacteria bacterium]|nr:PDZ domain-containing protein [Candidatus Eisenbacteria bacterium]
PADDAGVLVADILRKVNGVPVSSTQEFRSVVFDAQIGDQIRLELERNGQPIELDVVLKEDPRGD